VHDLFHKRLSPCEDASETCPMEPSLETRSPTVVQHRHCDPAGSEHIAEITAAPIINEEGEVVQMIEICPRYHRAEKGRRRAEGKRVRFRQLADSMPQIVWAARPDGYIDYYNQRRYEYIRISPHSPETTAGCRRYIPRIGDRVVRIWERLGAQRPGLPGRIPTCQTGRVSIGGILPAPDR